MRRINELIIHCSATHSSTTLEHIRNYHKEVKKWNDIGYHYVIEHSGKVRYGRPVETKGAHCKNHNSFSIGICLIGGTNSEGTYYPFTPTQIDSLVTLIEILLTTYPITKIRPHNYYANKLCPDFILSNELPKSQLPYLKERKKLNNEVNKHYKKIK